MWVRNSSLAAEVKIPPSYHSLYWAMGGIWYTIVHQDQTDPNHPNLDTPENYLSTTWTPVEEETSFKRKHVIFKSNQIFIFRPIFPSQVILTQIVTDFCREQTVTLTNDLNAIPRCPAELQMYWSSIPAPRKGLERSPR